MSRNVTVIKQFVRRNAKLRDIGIHSYQEFLKSPVWLEIRARYEKKRREGKHLWTHCYCCDRFLTAVHLHHLNYKSVTSPVLGSRIRPLCPRCHELVHKLTEKHIGWSIRKVTNHLRDKFFKQSRRFENSFKSAA